MISKTIMIMAIAAAFVAGTVTTATIVSAEGDIIYACVHTGQGKDLRIVDSLDDCRNNETPLQWNTQGPQGATGPAGADGMDGAVGPAGATGPAGAHVYGYVYKEDCNISGFPFCDFGGGSNVFTQFDPSGIISLNSGGSAIAISQSGLYHIEFNYFATSTQPDDSVRFGPNMAVGSNPTNCNWTTITEELTFPSVQVTREMTCTFAAGDEFAFTSIFGPSSFDASLLVTKIG